MGDPAAAWEPSVGIGPQSQVTGQARIPLLLNSPEALTKDLAGQWESVKL